MAQDPPLPPLTSSFPRMTNVGIPLHNEYHGGESDTIREIPPEWRAALDLKVTEQPVPTDYPLFDLTDEILASKLEQTVTSERKLRTTRKPPGTFTLLEKFTDKHKEFGTRTRNFRFIDDFPSALAVPSATRDVSTKNFGNKHFEETIEEIPGIFTGEEFIRERPVVTPIDFRALLEEETHSITEAGTAVDPSTPLPAGVFYHGDVQEDLFLHRETTKQIDLLDLPKTITNYRTNRFKQLEIIARELRVDNNSPTAPTATTETEYTVLGDGTALNIVTGPESLFANNVAEIDVPDLVPEIFKAVFPTETHEFTDTSLIDDPPVLGTTDYHRREEQVDVFNRRVRVTGRPSISLPQELVALRRIGGLDFGGEVLQLVGRLAAIEPAVEEGLGVVSSQVQNLGNGTYFRQTEKWNTATEWPELIGTEVDPRTGIVIGLRKKVVAAGTTGGVSGSDYTDVKPLDKWRSVQIVSSLNTDSLPDPKTWETTVEHRFPNELLAAAWVWAAASAPFAYDFDMALVLDMKEGYAGPCRAKITESFSIGPPSDVVTPTIFCPQGHMIGYAWAFAADPSEDCGSCIGIARANARTWTIPPSIHDEISIGGGVTLVNGTFTDTLPATTPASLPAPGTLITKACDVEQWRFGVFYRRLVEIYVPDCDS